MTDRRIKELQRSGRINISPYDEVNIQPVSYEVHLGDLYTVPQMRPGQMFVDPGTTRTLPHSEYISLPYRTGVFLLHPGKFILSHIAEHIKYSAGVAGFFHGKSSLGRLGLLVHVTAGLADPGWEGRLTVELKNLADYPIRLWRGMPIGQMVFEDLGEDVEVPYGSPQLGSHYQGDDQVRPAQALRLD